MAPNNKAWRRVKVKYSPNKDATMFRTAAKTNKPEQRERERCYQDFLIAYFIYSAVRI